jgi:peptidoglycan-associated lipoprotein
MVRRITAPAPLPAFLVPYDVPAWRRAPHPVGGNTMRHTRPLRLIGFALAATTSLGACATKGFVRTNLEAQRQALTADIAAERAGRMAGDSAVRADVARDLAALRADLTALRNEFGAKITAMEGKVQFAFPVHFAFDDATVRDTDRAALERFAEVVRAYYNGAQITVEGFADPAGSRAYNLDLSQRRADAVREFLSERGVSPSLLSSVGYGSTRQVRPGAMRDEPGAQLNRRVAFVIETPSEATVAAISMR